MGWEERNGSRYYYRKRRDGKRVVSEYVGNGLAASLAAQMDEATSTELQAKREALRREIAEQDAIDAQIDEVCRMTERLTRAALMAAGFHLHKGQWRFRRDTEKAKSGETEGS